MLKNNSFKNQFTIAFIMTIALSIISTIVLGIFLICLISNNPSVTPANVVDKQAEELSKYIQQQRIDILDEKDESGIENKLLKTGFRYRVILLETGESYGTISENLEINKKDLVNKINTQEVTGSHVMRFIPILDSNSDIEGVFILSYSVKMIDDANHSIVENLDTILLLSPFMFLIFYLILFGRIIAKNIKDPLDKLIYASKKVKNYDLDFDLKYPYKNEMADLVGAFNAMKIELKSTLTKQLEVEKEKKEMISALSHDLRTPLSIIKGHVEIINEGLYKNEEKLLTYLSIIESSNNRAILLVDDLYLLSKVDSSEFRMNIESINLMEFINLKFEEYKALESKYKVKFNISINGINEKSYFMIDRLRISQVIDNIIMNSIRYTKKNDNIDINVMKIKNNLKISILDYGIGFSESDLESAFKKFYKGDKSRTNDSSNSGLGLYISKTIIEKHYGDIKIFNHKCGAAVEVNLYNKAQNKN